MENGRYQAVSKEKPTLENKLVQPPFLDKILAQESIVEVLCRSESVDSLYMWCRHAIHAVLKLHHRRQLNAKMCLASVACFSLSLSLSLSSLSFFLSFFLSRPLCSTMISRKQFELLTVIKYKTDACHSTELHNHSASFTMVFDLT